MNYLTKLPNAVFDALEFLGAWLTALWNADVLPDAHLLLRTAVVGAIFMGSAFLAATVAEMAGRGMFLHFCGGLVLPYVYPIALMFLLKRAEKMEEQHVEIAEEIKRNAISAKLRRISEEREEARRIRRGGAAKPADEAAADSDMPDFSRLRDDEGEGGEARSAPAVTPDGKSVAPPEPREERPNAASGLTRRYIESVAVDSAGNRAGPFAVKLRDGRVLTAISIKGIQDELATFEIETPGGPKNIRLRFDGIDSCDRI